MHAASSLPEADFFRDLCATLDMGLWPPRDGADLEAWSHELCARRYAAKLTRRELADSAGMPDSTLRNLETGRDPPARTTLMRLQSLSALARPEPPPAGIRPSCNCGWDRAPAWAQALSAAERGPGQECILAPPISLGELVVQIATEARGRPLDLIALSPGRARTEVRLAEALRGAGCEDLWLFLLDRVEQRLRDGYRHAAEVLGKHLSVGVFALQSDYEALPRYRRGPARVFSIDRHSKGYQAFQLVGLMARHDFRLAKLWRYDTAGSSKLVMMYRELDPPN